MRETTAAESNQSETLRSAGWNDEFAVGSEALSYLDALDPLCTTFFQASP
jgi:hypothetical protein